MQTSPSDTQIKASQSILNSSVSKMMFSFGKSPRFPTLKRSAISYSFYNLPSTRSNRSTSLGYGSKTDFTLLKKGVGDYPEIKRDFDIGTKLGPYFSSHNYLVGFVRFHPLLNNSDLTKEQN